MVHKWTIFTERGSGGIMADVCLFLARPYVFCVVFCVVFLYSRRVKEARLRFSNTALPKIGAWPPLYHHSYAR